MQQFIADTSDQEEMAYEESSYVFYDHINVSDEYGRMWCIRK